MSISIEVEVLTQWSLVLAVALTIVDSVPVHDKYLPIEMYIVILAVISDKPYRICTLLSTVDCLCIFLIKHFFLFLF